MIEFELTFPIVYVIRVTHRTVMTPKTKEEKPFRGYRLTNWETISHPIVVFESYNVQMMYKIICLSIIGSILSYDPKAFKSYDIDFAIG